MRDQKAWLEIFEKHGAILTSSHFIYTSGKHGDTYVNKDALYPHTALMSEIGEAFAEAYSKESIEVVVAPAVGGIILTQWTAFHLSRKKGKEVLAVYAEKSTDPPGFVLKRGYDTIVANKNVLVLEDVLNTGGSVQSVLKVLANSKVKGIAAVCNRGNLQAANFGGIPLFSLTTLNLQIYEATSCPLCQKAVPFNKQVGKA